MELEVGAAECGIVGAFVDGEQHEGGEAYAGNSRYGCQHHTFREYLYYDVAGLGADGAAYADLLRALLDDVRQDSSCLLPGYRRDVSDG